MTSLAPCCRIAVAPAPGEALCVTGSFFCTLPLASCSWNPNCAADRSWHAKLKARSCPLNTHFMPSASKRLTVRASFTMAEGGMVEECSMAPGIGPGSITEWEIDFCSRPILDDRGKKLWELAACDPRRQFQYARFFPNNVINSITLKDAILAITQKLGLSKPLKIRFFRSQMQTIVSKACSELGIQAVPSQRCITLMRWLEERYESVYQHLPGFQEGLAPVLQLEYSMPLELPDNLRGEQWAFVQLPLSALLEEAAAVQKGSTFGSVFEIDTFGFEIAPTEIVPGVAVASSRALPLAAWMNALELSSLDVDRQRGSLVLSSGVSDRWIYASYQKSRQADQEAEAWEASKRACKGLHFLAVQSSLDSETCTGFWLLLDPRSRI